MDQGTHVRDDITKYLSNSFGTECVWIPKGLTYILQPLDVSVNAPFKSAMREEWKQWPKPLTSHSPLSIINQSC